MNESDPPPRYGTRRNPKTGAMETYRLPDLVDLAKARKELADLLHGGGWFEDPLSKPKEPEPQPYLYIGDETTWGTRSQRLAAAGFTRRPSWRSLPSDE